MGDKNQRFDIIGITDNRQVEFSTEVKSVISGGKVFSGGLRHKEIVAELLPENYTWINITVPLDNVFSEYKKHSHIVVFASGDPLFFGFANTVMRKLPEAEVKVYPNFNSLQLLAHRCLQPYHDMRTISLTGRPWKALDTALIEGVGLIGSLTDREKTPNIIAQRMLEYGFDNYILFVGECLGNELETVYKLKLSDASFRTFRQPNCVILVKQQDRERLFGIPESMFELLDGRANMITKAPIRLVTLSMLDLYSKHTFWDIGFCTGSVSIEVKLQFPHIDVFAFEKRESGERLITENSKKFGTPGITHFIGDFADMCVKDIDKPDAVFIGGHGGRMNDIVEKVASVIKENGVLVFNSVSDSSKEMFEQATERHGFKIVKRLNITVDNHNPIEIIKAIKR